MLDQPIPSDPTLYRNIIHTFAGCHAHTMVLRLYLTHLDRHWASDGVTLGYALDAAVNQGQWELLPKVLRGWVEGGGQVGAGRLRELLLQCAGVQAWAAAEEIIQVSGCTHGVSVLGKGALIRCWEGTLARLLACCFACTRT